MFFKKKKIIINGKEIELQQKPFFFKKPKIFNSKKQPQWPFQQMPQVEQQQQYTNTINTDSTIQKNIQPQNKPMRSKSLFSFLSRKAGNGESIKIKPIPQAPHIEIPKPNVEKVAEHPSLQFGVPKPQKETFFIKYAYKIISKHKGLIDALREQKITPPEFVKKILINSLMIGILVIIILLILLPNFGISTIDSAVLAVALGSVLMFTSFQSSIKSPLMKKIQVSKHAEKDILFAAREIIISLRSGMPLFNAIVSVSQGYGDSSVGFKHIVENVQLGIPLQDAIDDAITNSKSTSFRRLMIQASMSIRIGSDIIAALQTVINQLSEERVIELRAYGQRLNALAMFYMLFGVILPSMGIAVATILTTFIPIITINVTMLAFGLFGILFLQFMFLQMVRSGRPIFSM